MLPSKTNCKEQNVSEQILSAQINNKTDMFLKQAYDRRIRKEEDDISKLISLKKHRAPKIGSVKNDKINYDQEEQFFSKEDIPQAARTIKESIREFVDPDYLGLRKKEWNTSVSVPKHLEEDETHEQKLLKIKLGYLDHPFPKYKQPKIYPGTQTRDDYTKWNVSHEVLHHELKKNLLKKTQSAFQNTRLKQTLFTSTYVNPLTRTINHIEASKQKIQSEAEKRQKLKEFFIFQNPTASEEKINGAVFRLAYQSAVKEKKDDLDAQAMKTDFKASLTQQQKSRVTTEYSHSGIWQKFVSKSPGDEDYYAWSCCMNEDVKSAGCMPRIKDSNKWNLTSFNNP